VSRWLTVIKRISEERKRIDSYKHTVGGAAFFNDPVYREDFEWLMLSYLTGALAAVGWKYPEYAEKLMPPLPDAETVHNAFFDRSFHP
jgi:hypothetical protein